jgi:DNA modification methylase
VHAGLLEVGGEIAKKLNYLWTIACYNGDFGGATMRHDFQIRCCWRPLLMFCHGAYRPLQSFDDAVITRDPEKSLHDRQQPLSEATFYIKALSGPKSVVCDPFLGSGTAACAVCRLGQGRLFRGAEIDAETCAIACRRVTRSDHRTRVRIVQITRLRMTLITRHNL